MAEIDTMVGAAPAFRDALAQISQLAPLDRPVLVVGERGTGKELVAARITYLSQRWDRPFLTVNCAALAEGLLDSELFGHEAGAFTGALRRRASRFELAHQGTLFLDEIGQSSLAVQEKVLRVIEYGSFTRVGGNEPIEVDVRVIAATNADLPSLAAQGKFRADLLDRLAFDVVTLPPLRARREDIPLLAEHFGRAMARSLGRGDFPGFTEQAMRTLMAHDWPGNVRELKNAVERSLYRAGDGPQDRIVLDPFASPFRPTPAQIRGLDSPERRAQTEPFATRVADFERAILERALFEHGNNQKRAADALGLGYHQFRRQLRKRGLIPRSGG